MSRLPEFGEVMEAAFGARLAALRAIEPGEVISWSRTSQTADVRPVILGTDRSPRAEIPSCAVVFPGAYWDIQVGETGLLLVCDSDYRRWWRDGEDAVAQTTASHAIGNSVFLPGLRSYAGSRSLPSNATVLEKPAIAGSVRLGIYSAQKAALHEDLLVDLKTLMNALSTWVTAVNAAAGPFASTAPLQAAILAVVTGVDDEDYQSPSVKVED